MQGAKQLKPDDSAVVLHADGSMTIHIARQDKGNDEPISVEGFKIGVVSKLISSERYEPIWNAICAAALQEMRDIKHEPLH